MALVYHTDLTMSWPVTQPCAGRAAGHAWSTILVMMAPKPRCRAVMQHPPMEHGLVSGCDLVPSGDLVAVIAAPLYTEAGRGARPRLLWRPGHEIPRSLHRGALSLFVRPGSIFDYGSECPSGLDSDSGSGSAPPPGATVRVLESARVQPPGCCAAC